MPVLPVPVWILVYLVLVVVLVAIVGVWAKRAHRDYPIAPSKPTPGNIFVWRNKMTLAVMNDEPYVVYRSGATPEELRRYLQDELAQHLSCLDAQFEPIEGSVRYEIPDAKHQDTYDGSVSIRIRLKPVA